jgi:hypothetical protein
MDGRKTRWQKGRATSDAGLGPSAIQRGSLDSSGYVQTAGDNLQGPSTGCLFDLLMGEPNRTCSFPWSFMGETLI